MSNSPDYAPSVGSDARDRSRQFKRRFLVTLPLGVVIMVLSMSPPLQFTGWQWVVGALTLPIVTWGAWPFSQAAFKAAIHGSTTMDTLVSLGIIASAAWSYWALFWGGAGTLGMKMSMSIIPQQTGNHPELYFEGAAMIVVFLLGGRWAEANTKYKASDALRELLTLGAKRAVLLTDDGERLIDASELKVGDLFLVRPGEKVATDAVVVEGHSALDTSLLTGESLPVDVVPGDEITGATINTWGTLKAQATKVGKETALAQIGRMVSAAQASKAPVQRIADRVSSIFVPLVIAISGLTLAGWLVTGHSVQAAFTAAVAVLVVACPCALGLATPTALLVGSGRASQLGIIIRNAEVLEQSQAINMIVLDKTGTVTTGNLAVEEALPTSVLPIAAALEQNSEHPLAKAITKSVETTPLPISGFTNHVGHGVSGLLDGELVLVGGTRWLATHGLSLPKDWQARAEQAEASGATVVAVAKVRGWVDVGVDPTGLGPTELNPAGLGPAGLNPAEVGSPKGGASLFAGRVPSRLEIRMRVGGMTCASCVNRVERKLKKLPGVDAQVNLATEIATITSQTDYSDEELKKVVSAAGYDPQIIGRELKATSPEVISTEQSGPAVSELSVSSTTSQRILPEQFVDATVEGIIILRDSIKPSSAEAITELRSLGIEPVLLSGDNLAATNHVATKVGITQVVAQALPGQKRQEIERLQNSGHIVAMVGDGVNDAAALAQATVGIAMGSGTDVAMAAADITLVNSDLRSVPTAIRISRRTLKTIKGNLFWAFAYNVAAIPLACAGLLNPMIAAAAMAFSSVFVVLNSLRLRLA